MLESLGSGAIEEDELEEIDDETGEIDEEGEELDDESEDKDEDELEGREELDDESEDKDEDEPILIGRSNDFRGTLRRALGSLAQLG